MEIRKINYELFNSYINKICRDIAISKWRPDYIVGITRGGLTAAVMISHWFDIPMHALNVSLRDSEIDAESNLWMAEDAFYGKNILIVDDINDSGATINWIRKDWMSGCYPNDTKWENVWNNNVKFATIVDNLSSQCRVSIDFTALKIDKSEVDEWVEFHYEIPYSKV